MQILKSIGAAVCALGLGAVLCGSTPVHSATIADSGDAALSAAQRVAEFPAERRPADTAAQKVAVQSAADAITDRVREAPSTGNAVLDRIGIAAADMARGPVSIVESIGNAVLGRVAVSE